MRILSNVLRNKSTYLTLGVYSLLYHFIPFIALLQIYSLFVFNFNFLVHKKIYFAIFCCIYLHISTYSAYYLHISAFLIAYFMAYVGGFYCIKIRSLFIINFLHQFCFNRQQCKCIKSVEAQTCTKKAILSQIDF